MPLYLTASHSSALKRSNTEERSSASPFSGHARTKPAAKRKQPLHEDGEDAEERLHDTGKILPLAANSKLKTVPEAIDDTLANLFSEIPDRAGMNSVRIAEVLNFRKRLPPLVSVAHIHSLITASTRTEREIAQMIAMGSLRKIAVAGRGNDISGLGEFIIRATDYEQLIDSANLTDDCKSAFKQLLRDNPRAVNLPARLIQPGDLTSLIKAGFLVSSSAYERISHGSSSTSTQFAPSRLATITPTGTHIPIHDSSFENLRAGGISTATQPANASSHNPHNNLTLSVPNLGPYLRLLSSARSHLLDLLGKSSKYREAPVYLLKERWDGAVESTENRVSQAKRMRGEFAGLLPGRTKRWKQLFGLEFDWVLQECLGAGLVEEFETKSVGIGVRVV